MSIEQVCAACSGGDCHRCVPDNPRRDEDGLFMGSLFIGGTTCPCRHTDEDRAEWQRQAKAAFDRFFGKRGAP